MTALAQQSPSAHELGALLRRQPQIILGSASLSRRSERTAHQRVVGLVRQLTSRQSPWWCAGIMDQVAAELGISYRVLAADLDERALGAGAASPSQLVMLLARAKAAALQSRVEAAAQPGGAAGAGSSPPTPQDGSGVHAPGSSETGRADAPLGVASADTAQASAPAAQQAALRERDPAQGALTAPWC